MTLKIHDDGPPQQQQIGRRQHLEGVIRRRLELLDARDREKTGRIVGHRLKSMIRSPEGVSVIGDEWTARQAAPILRTLGYCEVRVHQDPANPDDWIAAGNA